MPQQSPRVRIEGMDFARVFPVLHLFRAFKMAIHPRKLLLALLLVVLLYTVGVVLDDHMYGPSVYATEVQKYTELSRSDFAAWRKAQPVRVRETILSIVPELDEKQASQDDVVALIDDAKVAVATKHKQMVEKLGQIEQGPGGAEARETKKDLEGLFRGRMASILALEPQGVFRAALHHEVSTFRKTLRAATQFEFGFTQFLLGHTEDSQTVVGGLYEMFVTVPLWLLGHHRLFLVTYCAFGLLLWGLFGGALSRMAALHATKDVQIGPSQAVRFAFKRWHWFVMAPVIPVGVSLVLAGVLVAFGFVFFGIPKAHVILDLIGGILFILAILVGLALTLLLIGLIASYNMIYPGISTDDCDGFEANTRAFSYLITRPWHVLGYYCVSLVYGAVTYLFFALVIFGSLSAAQSLVSQGAGLWGTETVNSSRFDAMFPPPELGRLTYQPEWSILDSSGEAGGYTSRVSAIMIMVWVYMFVGLLAAFAISFYFNSQTLVYLLMRASVDKTDMDESVLMSDDEADAGIEPKLTDPMPVADKTEREEKKG
jgi:hypothetical protein